MAIKSDEYYKEEVEKIEGYEFVKVVRKNDVLLDGKSAKNTYIRIKHRYCGSVYEVYPYAFLRHGDRCMYCCREYINSIAYHIEQELGEPLERYWDFEKNQKHPRYMWKGSNKKVWIKCQEKDYHGSYEIMTSNFIKGVRCGYCSSAKIHPKDSFAQYHIDNTDFNFLEKYWDYEKNVVDPWELSINNDRQIWIKCQNEETHKLNGLMKKTYHDSYKIKTNHFTSGVRCGYCNSKKIHPYDSFGYHNLDKAMSWHPDNDISPFRVGVSSGKKYKFICDECNYEWVSDTNHITRDRWCPVCAKSKGEKKVKAWLDYNNIDYIHDKQYFEDLIGTGGGLLRPDFILPEHKIWIEYDGEFHYKDMTGNLQIQREHDKRKNKYAKLNNWKLIRIPYWDFFNIEKILNYEIF